jgi:hypothetical protein
MNEQIERVRTKLTNALNGVHNELAKCRRGQHAVDSEETLLWMAEGLGDMLESLDKNDLTSPPGFWHVISDGWPLKDELGDKIVDAEHAYKQLS